MSSLNGKNQLKEDSDMGFDKRPLLGSDHRQAVLRKWIKLGLDGMKAQPELRCGETSFQVNTTTPRGSEKPVVYGTRVSSKKRLGSASV